MQIWHIVSKSPHQDCLSNDSNSQPKQILAVQHHQLYKQVKALEVFCHFHPPLRLWNIDPFCWLKKKRIQAFETKCMRKSFHINLLLGAEDQRLGAEQDQLPCWSTWTSSGNCQETETCKFRANHPSGHLGQWAKPWSAEEMLDGHRQRVDNPAHARTAYMDFRHKRLEEDVCWIVSHVSPTTQSVEGLNWTNIIIDTEPPLRL